MKSLKLKYRLTKEEIEEMLLCLDWKREGKLKSVNLIILSILGTAVLVAYIRKPEQIYWFFILLLIILLLFYLWYGPKQQRKKNAEKITIRGGGFQLIITDDSIQPVGSSQEIMLKDRKIKFYISENMYILKANREICAIPKRILSKQQKEKLVGLIRRYHVDTINVVIKKE